MRIVPTNARLLRLLGAAMLMPLTGAASELGDIVARIDFGFYTHEPRMIEAARGDLVRMRATTGARDYYAAYAAYRLSQLDAAATPRERRGLIAECLEAADRSAQSAEWAVEARILAAACSLQGIEREPARALGHGIRLEQALTEARELDADHPRLLLVAAASPADGEPVGGEPEPRRVLLERAREAFAARSDTLDGPGWGRAETLAQLAQLRIAHGERREARDLIEQALLEAPEYYFALELKKTLSLGR